MRVLLVNGFGAEAAPAQEITVARSHLEAKGHEVTVSNLADEGFDQFMSAAERHAYHGDGPLLCAETRRAADQLQNTQAVAILYPSTHRCFPARVKSWNERVFVPGVAFKFKPSGVITGALDHLDRTLVISIHRNQSRLPLRTRLAEQARAAAGPSLARSFYLSSNRVCRSRFTTTAQFDEATAKRVFRRW